MTLESLTACFLVVAAATVFAAPPRVASDPNDPAKRRTILSTEEREKLGVTPHSWTGVMHPDVYPTVERLSKNIASLKERLSKTKDEQAFDALEGIRFEGTVYVQVEAKDVGARQRVLASMKASEFHPQMVFERWPVLTGFANKDALGKLQQNADVIGVCLDDKPLPEGMIVVKSMLAPAQPGDTTSEQPGVKEGKIEADVYHAFALADRVDVMVSLRGESLPQFNEKSSDLPTRVDALKKAVRQIQDRVLSAVNADEFWLWTRHGLTPTLRGRVTKEGLHKLEKQPDVQRIYLQRMVRLPERNLKTK